MIKKIIYIFILYLLFINITEAQIILKNTNLYENINTLIESNNEILILKENTIIEKYDLNNNYITKKEYPDLYNSNITKYKDGYLLTGIHNNKVNIYEIDNNLKINNIYEIDTIVNNIDIKTNIYNNKIYIVLTNNNLIINNKIYEIDNKELKEYNLKEYNEIELNNILKEDYYLLKDTLEMNDTIYQKVILYNNVLYYMNNNKIKIKNNDKEIIKEIEYNIKDITIIENEIYLLNDNSIKIYDLNMNYLREIQLNKEPLKFIKTSNKLYIKYNDSLDKYEFNYNIENNYQPYGTLEVLPNEIPGNEVELNITTNSGYAINTIDIKDEKGNEIEVNNNKFIMPEGNVNINVTYIATINNPETSDIIYVVIIMSIIFLVMLIKIAKKYIWIKRG